MSSSFYGPNAAWPEVASFSASGDPFDELQHMAERAGLSVEHLCIAAEHTTLFDDDIKSVPSTFSYDNDLEEVVRLLADDEFDLEAKAVWNEADHPRDEDGRFTESGGNALNIEHVVGRHIPAMTTEGFEQVQGELNDIHREIQNIIGLKSRWSRELRYEHHSDLKAVGRKDFGCSITLVQEFFPDHNNGTDRKKMRRICTLLHESLHALAATTPYDYEHGIGWEEGVIDQMTRLHRVAIARKLHLSISKSKFERRDKGHPYSPLVKALEEIRTNLAEHGHELATDEYAFYHKLMTVPASKKKAFIIGECRRTMATASDDDRRTFRLMLERTGHILSTYKPPETESQTLKATQGQTRGMTRDELITMMLSTRTREEVIATQKAMTDWMKEHPDDYGIMEGGEMIAMLAERYGIRTLRQEAMRREQDILFARLEANPGLNIDAELQKLSTMKEDGTYDD